MDLSGLLRMLSVTSSDEEHRRVTPDSPELTWRSLATVGGGQAHWLTESRADLPKSALKRDVSLTSVGERRVRFSTTSSVTRPERSPDASCQARAQQEREAARDRCSEQIEKLILRAKQQSRHAMTHAGRIAAPHPLGDMRAVCAHAGSRGPAEGCKLEVKK